MTDFQRFEIATQNGVVKQTNLPLAQQMTAICDEVTPLLNAKESRF